MSSPDFQWFVAWRYLLERPRQLSGAILTFVALFGWLGLGVGAAVLWQPLASSFYVPPPNVPPWLPMCFGLALAGAAVAVLTALAVAIFPARSGGAIRWARAVSPAALSTGTLALAAYAGLVALAAIGVYAWLLGHELVAERPALVASLWNPRRAAWVLVAVLQVPLALLVPRWIRVGGAGKALLWAEAGLVVLALAVPAGYGAAELVLGTLSEQGGVPVVLAGLGALLALVGAGVALAGRRRAGLNLALLGIAVAAAASGAAVWWKVTATVAGHVALLGGFAAVKTPMWLVIPGAIAAALIPLTLLLLGIRYVFTFFTTVSIGGVAIGSMALVVVLSVMSGFESDLREKILGSNAHIQVTLDHEAQMPGYRKVMDQIARAPGVVAQMPYLVSEVVISSGGNYYNVIIKGVDPATVGAVTDLDENLDAPDAIERLWPLAPDGTVIGAPAGAGQPGEPGEQGGGEPDGGEPAPDLVDPAPDDLILPDDQPIDFSGSGEPAPEAAGAAGEKAGSPEVVDPAPPELDLPPDSPIDFSGEGAGPLDFSGGDDGEAWPGEGNDERPIVQDDPEGGIDAFPLDDEIEEQIRDYIPPQVAVLPGVLVGSELVKQIHLYPGQEVKIVSPLAQDTPIGPVPRTKPMRVAGIFFTGMYEYDLKLVYVELGALQDFLDLGDEVNGIEIRVQDPEMTAPTVAALRAALGEDFEVRDWKELNKSLFSALKLEKIAMFLVLVIIILVASFSIVGNLIMVVVEKAREIAVLKTLGASDRGVMKIFVVQGFFIGLVGTALGVSLGLTICWLLMRYGLPLDPDVYYIDRLPVHVEPLAVVAVAVAGVLISVIATVYPAFVASRLRPVQGLRYE